MKINSLDKVVHIPKAPRGVLDPLDLGVDGFAGRICDSMTQIRDDVFESSFEHSGDLDDRF